MGATFPCVASDSSHKMRSTNQWRCDSIRLTVGGRPSQNRLTKTFTNHHLRPVIKSSRIEELVRSDNRDEDTPYGETTEAECMRVVENPKDFDGE